MTVDLIWILYHYGSCHLDESSSTEFNIFLCLRACGACGACGAGVCVPVMQL